MAPVEFEKELKKRLRSREVRPSSGAWERIASRLDKEDPGHRRGPVWWMGLAAASVVLLAALAFFWDRSDPLPVTGPVVSTPEVPTPAGDPGQVANPIGLTPEPVEATLAETSEKPDSQPIPGAEEPGTGILQARDPGLAAAPLQDSSPLQDPDRISGLIALQMDTVIARVVALEQAKEVVSDARIDSLLHEAQQTIVGKGGSEGQPSVDPSMLLAQAEDELDQTFREKIMEKLRTEYTRIRSSVADRNK